MATTLNTNNGLSLAVIAAETLPVLQKKLATLSSFTTDFSPEVLVGTSVSTRYATPMSASAYDATTGYASSAGATTAVDITLSNHFYRTVNFTPIEIQNVGLAKLQSVFIQPAVNAIVNGVYQEVYKLVVASNYPHNAYSASSANFGWDDLVGAKKVLDMSGSAAASAILNPTMYTSLLTDLKDASVIGDPSVIREGKLGTIAGVNTYMDAQLPTQNLGLAGFVCRPDAVCIAGRLPFGEGPGVESTVVTDPDSGFSIKLMQYYVPHLGQWSITATTIFGVAKGNPSSLTKLVDTLNP